jgi:hypothetical protein
MKWLISKQESILRKKKMEETLQEKRFVYPDPSKNDRPFMYEHERIYDSPYSVIKTDKTPFDFGLFKP